MNFSDTDSSHGGLMYGLVVRVYYIDTLEYDW